MDAKPEIAYEKPELTRFGTFRELTLWGIDFEDGDGGIVFSTPFGDVDLDGCQWPDGVCRS